MVGLTAVGARGTCMSKKGKWRKAWQSEGTKNEVGPRPMKGGGTSKAWLFRDFVSELGFEAVDDGRGHFLHCSGNLVT